MVIGESIPGPNLQTCISASLRDLEHARLGCLRLHTADPRAVATGTVCELVAISGGQATNPRDEGAFLEEWMLEGRPEDAEFYEFVNVLWIERMVVGLRGRLVVVLRRLLEEGCL